MIIQVKDLGLLEEFLQAAQRLVPCFKLNVGTNESSIIGVNDSSTVKLFLTTNCLAAKEELSLCLKDIQKFLKAIQTVREFSKSTETELEFNGSCLSFKKEMDFRLTTVKEDIIQKYVSNPLKTELIKVFGFTLTQDMFKKILSISFINSSESPKVYFLKKDNSIFAELDDKCLSITDSIGIPVSNKFEGEWVRTIIVGLENFRNFNILDCKEVCINMTDKAVLQIDSEVTVKDLFVKSKIIAAVKKQ